ncbi:MAG: biotin transporter BioY [Eubacterium sp.]|nr:biotin transporter BioY [Eubacterium sp.]
MKKLSVSEMAVTAVMTAVCCVLGPLSVPIGPVPVSLGILGVLLSVYILGRLKGTIAVLIYLLIGFAGVPVFAGFTAGAGKLLGPTGGYLIGYIFLSLIAGTIIDKFPGRYIIHVAAMVLGVAVCYAFGTAWLSYVAGMSFSAALFAGVIPFIPFDLCKIIVTAVIAPQIKKALNKANLIQESNLCAKSS